MKRLTLFALSLIALTGVWAQQEAKVERMDDRQRIALTAVVLDDQIPAAAAKQLVNKMSQIATKSGCSATSNSRFIITCTADVLTKDITPTAPPMHAYTLNLTFFIGDGVEGRLFSSTNIEAKGVGETPDKAYIAALKNMRINDPTFKAFVDKGKTRIIEYYNTRCDMIMAEAKAKMARQEYTDAIAQLTAVPSVCEECYNKALDASVEVYKAWRENFCQMALTKAKAAWANRDSKAAAEALADVPADADCAADVDKLRKEISGTLEAKEKQEWELKQQQYEAEQMAREQRMEQAERAATNAVATATAAPAKKERAKSLEALKEVSSKQAPQPEYEVKEIKGKWFQ